MKIITKLISAACVAGALAGATVAPAEAASFGFSFGFGNGPSFSSHGPGWNQRGDWRYRHWPRNNFSFNVGPIRGGNHAARCDARYRSYDWRTDTYMGNDGDRHRCRL
jgi:hypothetical protein